MATERQADRDAPPPRDDPAAGSSPGPSTLPLFGQPAPSAPQSHARARSNQPSPPAPQRADPVRSTVAVYKSLRSLSDAEWVPLQRTIKRFEADWQGGGEPNLDDYLGESGAHRLTLLVELLLIDLEYRLRLSRPHALEDYLARYPELNAEAAARLVSWDYELRRPRGSAPAPETYFQRFPWIQTELRARLAALDPDSVDRGRTLTQQPPRTPYELPPGGIVGPLLPSKFQLIRKLGGGGMGDVWLVRHVHARIERAVKVIAARVAEDPEARARFVREAVLMAQLGHRHTVTVHDVGVDEHLYIEMEYVRGKDLSRWLEAKVPMPLEWTLRILEQLCGVLDAAHAKKIVHRDLKPSNLMLVEGMPEGDNLKVLDFGIAKAMDQGPETFRTTPGQLLGTLQYMSPEQAQSSDVDGRADIYSVGVILYEMLTGTRPFQATSLLSLFHEISTTPPPKFRARNPSAEVPPEIEALVLRCLAKDPADRPQTAGALAAGFRELVGRELARRRALEQAARADAETLAAQRRRRGAVLRRRVFAAMVPLLALGSYGGYLATRPPFTLSAHPVEIEAGNSTPLTIEVAARRPGTRVRVEAAPVASRHVRVRFEREKSTDRRLRFRVEAALNPAAPAHLTLGFRATDGRHEESVSVPLSITRPNLAPLPPLWKPQPGSPLARVDGKVYPKAIERTFAGLPPVVALLVEKSSPGQPDPFYIMRDKVWVSLYRVFLSQNPGGHAGKKEADRKRAAPDEPVEPALKWWSGGPVDPLLPVFYVTGEEATAFAHWLGGPGRGHLPTEAQWKQAAGFDQEGFYPGLGEEHASETPGSSQASAATSHLPLPVDRPARNLSPFGCRDMYGNGLEWTRHLPDDRFQPWLGGRSYGNSEPWTADSFKDYKSLPEGEEFDRPTADIGFRVAIELDRAPGS